MSASVYQIFWLFDGCFRLLSSYFLIRYPWVHWHLRQDLFLLGIIINYLHLSRFIYFFIMLPILFRYCWLRYINCISDIRVQRPRRMEWVWASFAGSLKHIHMQLQLCISRYSIFIYCLFCCLVKISVQFLSNLQYRMCASIMELSNALIYGNRLRCGSTEIENAKLKYRSSASSPAWLMKVLTSMISF